MEQKELTTATSTIKEETKMKNIVIINEQHSLLKQQEEVIAKKIRGTNRIKKNTSRRAK